ncbi:hypothetical protein MRX96_025724 [Rhipicephalus microplus]
MSCLDVNIRVEKHSPLRWVRNAAFIYQSCLTSNGTRDIRELLLTRQHKRSPASPQPFTNAPGVVFRIGLQKILPQLQSDYLEQLGVNPLASVYVAPAAEEGAGGENQYVSYVDSPELIMKRFFLRYPDRTESDYKRLIEKSLLDVENASLVATSARFWTSSWRRALPLNLFLDVYDRRVADRADNFRFSPKIFYYAYAMGQCEKPGTDTVQIRKFSRCSRNFRMAPRRRCIYWNK